ncbi:hypothetical protein Q8A73_018242 [Channa argus]|nr:hypothetical protein Q8A73_018242 [Channa argus]
MTTGLHAPRRSSGGRWTGSCPEISVHLALRSQPPVKLGHSSALSPIRTVYRATGASGWQGRSFLLTLPGGLPTHPPPPALSLLPSPSLPTFSPPPFRFLIPGVRHPAFTGLVMRRFHVEPRGKTIGNAYNKDYNKRKQKPPLASSSTTTQSLCSAGQDHPEGACSGTYDISREIPCKYKIREPAPSVQRGDARLPPAFCRYRERARGDFSTSLAFWGF